MRFILESEKDVFTSNPSLGMTEHLSKLSNREVKWIVLVYDYESPLSQMPLPIRKVKAGTMTGWAVKGAVVTGALKIIIDGKNKKVNDGIIEYKKIQFDENQEALIAYNEQLKEYRMFFKQKNKKPTELKLAAGLQKQMPELLKARDEIAKLVGLRAHDEEFEISDIVNASTIDKVIFEEEQLKDESY